MTPLIASDDGLQLALLLGPSLISTFSTDRTITFTLKLAGDVAAFTESVRSEIASAIATAASVNARDAERRGAERRYSEGIHSIWRVYDK